MTQEPTLAALLNEALHHHQGGALERAAALYRAMLARDPQQADAHHLLGLVAQAHGDLAAAEAGIRRALAIRPDEALFHYNLANVLRAAGRLEEALAGYRAALARRPDDPDSLLNLGALLAERGEHAAAAVALRALLRIAPGNVAAQLNLAQVLRAAGDAVAARAAYEAALALAPGEAEAHLGLAALLQEAGDPAGARRHYQAALTADPADAAAWNDLGAWHQEQGARDAARDCYRRALALDPQHAAAHNNLGTLLADDDRLLEAEASYRAALAARPAFAAAHRNLGAVLQGLGRPDEALACYRAVLRLQPDDPEAAFKLAALGGAAPPASAPPEYVAALFDQYAGDYDRHLTATLGYRVPEALCALLAELGVPAAGLDVLDLGCGTGLSGVALRPTARSLTGVDLAPRMLQRARERGVYDRLIAGDIVAALVGEAPGFDLAMAADVFVYIGALGPVLAGVARVLRAGGWLAFSVEAGEGAGYALRTTGRYVHAPAYVEAQLGRHGFAPSARREVVLRVEQGRPVAGQLWVGQRTK